MSPAANNHGTLKGRIARRAAPAFLGLHLPFRWRSPPPGKAAVRVNGNCAVVEKLLTSRFTSSSAWGFSATVSCGLQTHAYILRLHNLLGPLNDAYATLILPAQPPMALPGNLHRSRKENPPGSFGSWLRLQGSAQRRAWSNESSHSIDAAWWPIAIQKLWRHVRSITVETMNRRRRRPHHEDPGNR